MVMTSFRYKIWIEGKEFFNKPGAKKKIIKRYIKNEKHGKI